MEPRRTPFRWLRRVALGLRELARTPVRFAFHLAVARLITQWRSLLTIIAGTLLSASIGALVPLYTTAVAQVGMTQRLAEEPARDAHVSASISLRASTVWPDGGSLADKVEQSTALVRSMAETDLGAIDGWIGRIVLYGESESAGLSQIGEDGEQLPVIGVRARLGYFTGWEQQIRVIEGRLPQDGSPDEIEVAIGLNVANELNLRPDTVIILDQGMDENGVTGGGHPTSRPFQVRIVGIVSPLDENAPYWMDPSPLRLLDRRTGSGRWDYEFILLTTGQAVYQAAMDYMPDTPNKFGWRVLLAHDNLPFSRIDTARDALGRFARDMRAAFTSDPRETGPRLDLGFTYHTRLIDFDQIRKDLDRGILLDYAKDQELLDAPFGLLLLQVGALVLFFLMVTAALVRRGERREIAMLQSRGAWDSQIVLLRGIEALLICALAVLIAPFVSQLLLTALGPAVANTDDFPLPLTTRVFLFAAIASGVTFLALMFTLRPVLRLPLVTAGGAATRSAMQHWWQRYYLDAFLAVIGLGALWVLVRNGTPLTDVNLGGKQADPLMLMAPALLFLALGSLALRLFPLAARLAAEVSSAGHGLLRALATWQLSREPIHYGRITFLLALAIGIGWFATSFRATVTNSHEDQAKYLVGTDVRFTERDTHLNVNRARPAETYTAQDGIEAASAAFRVRNTNLSTNVAGDLRGTILAIDPETFGQTLYWRSDLGDVYTVRAPGSPPDLPQRGEALPGVPARIGLWARFEVSRFFGAGPALQSDVGALVQRTELNLRLLDASGTWLLVPVDPVEIEVLRVGSDQPGLNAAGFVTSGWVYCEADLTALDYTPLAPLSLVSFYWQYRAADARGERGMRLTLADMQLIDAQGSPMPFPIFSQHPWEFLYDSGALATGQADPGWEISGERPDSLYVRWDQAAQRSIVGVLLNYPDLGAVDAIASRRMQQENGLTWGTEASPFTLYNIGGSAVQFRAVQVTDYYPSLFNVAPSDGDPKGNTFMVVDARELLYRLNRRPSASFYPDEVWLRLDQSVNPRSEDAVQAVLRRLDQGGANGVVILNDRSLAEELGRLRTDPLALGLLGLMYLAFITALALSVVGLLTYSGLTAQARRSEFGVLRALGLSSLRVVGGLALEQGFVMGIGVTLGALLGAVLASQIVPTLAIGATGEGVIPPFVMRVEASRLVEYALLMVAVLGLVLGSSLLLVRQLSLARTLRLGEE